MPAGSSVAEAVDWFESQCRVPVTDAQLDAAGDQATALVRSGYGPVISLSTRERVA